MDLQIMMETEEKEMLGREAFSGLYEKKRFMGGNLRKNLYIEEKKNNATKTPRHKGTPRAT